MLWDGTVLPARYIFEVMMIFRISDKLNARIKTGTLHPLPMHENPFADWSARSFSADRTQYVIVTNTRSLYSALFYGRGVTSDSRFIDRAFSSIREFMENDGQMFLYQRSIVPASGSVRFARALNRSVTGSMNDLIFHAKDILSTGQLSPFDVGFQLNGIPFSALVGPHGRHYGTPSEVFRSMATVVGR